jgi:hypothetical protein
VVRLKVSPNTALKKLQDELTDDYFIFKVFEAEVPT